MILFYAALIGIPDELMEAATVDGATAWDVFWRIKFPLILPTVGIVGILTFVGNFNAFDLIYTMKGANAGPDFATDIMGTFFYRTFFGQQLQLGNPIDGCNCRGDDVPDYPDRRFALHVLCGSVVSRPIEM